MAREPWDIFFVSALMNRSTASLVNIWARSSATPAIHCQATNCAMGVTRYLSSYGVCVAASAVASMVKGPIVSQYRLLTMSGLGR